jgi:ribosome-binding factor A
MESIRQKQVGELIRRFIAMILTEEGRNIYGSDKLVTVTDVKMTPDLLISKGICQCIWRRKQAGGHSAARRQPHSPASGTGSKVGKQMRRMPDLEFHLDDTVDEMYRVSNLLNRVSEEDKLKN